MNARQRRRVRRLIVADVVQAIGRWQRGEADPDGIVGDPHDVAQGLAVIYGRSLVDSTLMLLNRQLVAMGF